MHQFMNNHFFHIPLLGICGVQQNNGFSVIAVNFEITGFAPRRVFHPFQTNIPSWIKAQFLYPFNKNLLCNFSVYQFLFSIIVYSSVKTPTLKPYMFSILKPYEDPGKLMCGSKVNASTADSFSVFPFSM